MPTLALYGATLTIAFSSVLVRRSYEFGGTPESVIVLRTGTPAVLLGLLVAFDAARGRMRGTLSRGLVLRLVALGCCLLGGSMGELHSLARLRAPIAILFFALAPLWIALLSRALYGTRLGKRPAAGLAIALTGVVIVVGVPSGQVDPVGALFAIGGGLAASCSFLLQEAGLAAVPVRLMWAIALAQATLVSLALHPSAPAELDRHTDVLRRPSAPACSRASPSCWRASACVRSARSSPASPRPSSLSTPRSSPGSCWARPWEWA